MSAGPAGSIMGWGSTNYGLLSFPAAATNVTAISACYNHALALRADGTVIAWGTDPYHEADVPVGLTNAVGIGGGFAHSVALKADGTVLAWGDNSNNEGVVPAGLSNVVRVSIGDAHNIAIKNDGSFVIWGGNFYGQLQVPSGLSNLIDVVAGGYHSLALKQDGTVVAWGYNNYGQTNVPGSLSNVVAVAGGLFHSLALKSDGTVVAWGYNLEGETNVPATLSNVAAITAGPFFNLALKSDGHVAAWGSNSFNQLNIASSPAPLFAASGGSSFTLGLTRFPVLVKSPTNQTVLVGTNVVLAAQVNSADPIYFQWQFNGVNLAGATDSVLTLANIQPTNAGLYNIIASNAFAAIPSGTATLTVNIPPAITNQPQSQTVSAGNPTVFNVSATGTTPLAFQWMYNGANLNAATNSSLTFAGVQFTNSGSYSVVVANVAGTVTSTPAFLTVNSPPIIFANPVSQTLLVTSNANFTVGAVGNSPLSYQWSFNGAPLANATNSSLAIGNAQPVNAGNYFVTVSNPFGSSNSLSAILAVNFPVNITGNPTDQTLPAGTNVIFSVSANGAAALFYQWQLNGSPITGATGSALALTNVQNSNAGSYTVVVTNTFGSATSSTANFVVLPSAPAIISQPADFYTFAGHTGYFNVGARGTEPLSYQWNFNGAPIAGQTNTSLTVSNTQSGNVGSYQIVVSNMNGTATSLVAALRLVTTDTNAIDWPQIQATPVASNIYYTVHIANAGDGSGRLFLVQQNGYIYIATNGVVLPTPFLTLTSHVQYDGNEQGLFSVAFPANYASKGYFYVNYTRKPDGATVVSRIYLSTNPNVANPASEQIILTIPQPAPIHNGGQIAFGPDGYLYIGMGDGGPEGDPNNQGQTPNSLLGKLLRIDVSLTNNSYVTPPDNPFYTNAAYRPEIWALGLRNPWRFSFDRMTGDLYIADVGQDNWEEIDFHKNGSVGGENYGWRVMEANHTNNLPPGFDLSQLTGPIIECGHNLNSCIIGGHVYRGPSSARMNGIYFFADYHSGRLWGAKFDGQHWQTNLLGTAASTITSFGEDEAGRLYCAASGVFVYSLIDSGLVAPVSFSPGANLFGGGFFATMTCISPGGIIHYTTDGRDPTESDPSMLSGGTLFVDGNLLLKARSFRPDLTSSAVSAINYSFKAVTPSVQPSSGPVTNGTPLTMSCSTPGAVIHYTLDGTTASSASPIYTQPLVLAGNQTLNAVATKQGYADSFVGTVFYGLVDYQNTTVTTLAGTSQVGTNDGPALQAQFSAPQGICRDTNGALYIADTGNHLIRKISPGGQVTTLAGLGTPGFQDGPAAMAKFSSPIGICVDVLGNIYVSDYGNARIRKIDLLGNVTTFAGSGTNGYQNGAAATAKFSNLQFLACDINSVLYAGDFGHVRKILPDGTVSTLAGGGNDIPTDMGGTVGVCVNNAGTIYSANDNWGWIYQITPAGVVTLFAGGSNNSADGPRQNALFLFRATRTTAADRFGNIYLSESTRIRKLDNNGWVSTIAGAADSGYTNGDASSARFKQCCGLCVDPTGTIYLADAGNNVIRKIVPIDSDGDGIPDVFEGGSTPYVVGVDDRFVDSDGDGKSNAAEFLAGTDPLDLSIRAFQPSTNGNVTLLWTSKTNTFYQVQFSSDLSNWNMLGGAVLGNSNLSSMTDTSGVSNNLKRFYRIQTTK